MNITGESLWRDEVDSVRFAFAPLSEIFANFSKPGQNGPLYHLALRGWLSLTGTSDFTLRYFSLIFGVLSVALVFVLARQLLGRKTAIFAMCLIAIAPTHVWYGSEGKMYTLQLVLLLMALTKCKAQNGKWKIADASVFVICTTLSYGVHLLSPLFVPIAFIFWHIRQPALFTKSKIQSLKSKIPFALVTLPYLPFVLWQLPLIRDGMHTGHAQYSIETVLLTLSLNWAYGLSDVMPLSLPNTWVWIAPLVFGVMAVAGGWQLHKTRRYGLILALLAWLILPATIVQIISLRVPLFEPRYVLWSSPALYLLVASGKWQGAGGKWQVANFAFCILHFLGLMALFTQPLRPDMRGAADWVRAQWQAGDALIFQMPYGRHAFAYYGFGEAQSAQPYNKTPNLTGSVFEAPFTNVASSPEWVALQMYGAQALSQRLWLVESETALWDERGFVHDWMQQHMPASTQHEFRGVTVSLHQHNQRFERVYLPVVLMAADAKIPPKSLR